MATKNQPEHPCAKRVSGDDKKLMIELGKLGISQREIARKFEITQVTCRKVLGTRFSLRYRFMKKCGICAEPVEQFRRAYWRFDGQEQQIYECCDACCRAMVVSINNANDTLINRRYQSGLSLRQLREESYRKGATA